ncbi:heparan sulfate 2-O-sulfotransferase hst-2-like [Trichogramma pretiosum]|uniref:heparan sulfate 2-O-sulfotransferase hst-2-like n=1 Tax=Trichogramma pretiosum TaxID=7493 RepID=UPI0006C96D9E|nr:heparan sulfate 2-O-sulfotransferase hst-2-like [Trichogramma pretiosum]
MRKCRTILALVILSLITGLVVLTSKSLYDGDDDDVLDGEQIEELPGYETLYQNDDFYEMDDVPRVTAARTVTKSTTLKLHEVTPSLAELGVKPSPRQDHVLMITRIPGTGVELLVLLLQKLQGFNAFKHIRLPPGDEGTLSNIRQELLVEEVTNIIRQEAIPLSFDGDVRFVNFATYGRPSPTYISLIRDPLDPKTISRFQNGKSSIIYRGSIVHFCGHDPRCSERNNEWALEQAKKNVLQWYPVVGVLDNMNETIRCLEQTFPLFYEGAALVYEKIRPKVAKTLFDYPPVKPNIKKRLKELLKTEVEFYEWVKQRLLASCVKET